MTKGFDKKENTFNLDHKGKRAPKGKKGGKSDYQKNDGIKFVKGEKRRTTVDENTKNMRRMYNRLMQKPKDQKEINKIDIVKKIIKQVNGNYSEICFKHDGCRILQGSIKYGDKNQRSEIIKNLIPHCYDLVLKKYAIYLAIKMFKYAENNQKEEIISKSVYPNFSKLMKSANGQMFLNFVFDNSSNSIQNCLVDYYLLKYLKVAEDKLKTMKDNILTNPTDPSNDVIIVEKQGTFQGESTRDEIKLHLEKQLEKEVHKNYIFQAFLNRIFDYFDAKTKVYISELFDDDLNEFLGHKSGVELACKLFTVANAKTRKKIIKKVKDNIKSFTSNETAVIFLIKVILFNDDTKLLEKYVLKTVLEQMNEEFMQNKNILKILCNIITPFSPRINNSYENKILSYKVDSGSKKDESKRHEELINSTLDEIFAAVNPNIKFFLADKTYCILLVDIVKYLVERNDDNKLGELLKNIHSVIQFDYQNNFDDLENTLLAEKSSHFVIKQILKSLVGKSDQDDVKDFFKNISNVLLKNIEGYLNTKAIFIIISILENPHSKQFIEAQVRKFKTLIKAKSGEKEMIGFQIINKILNL